MPDENFFEMKVVGKKVDGMNVLLNFHLSVNGKNMVSIDEAPTVCCPSEVLSEIQKFASRLLFEA